MNPRIRELMIKSGAFDYYEVNEGVNGDEKPMEKFAELLVRECAKFCDDKNSKLLGTMMKEHFGV